MVWNIIQTALRTMWRSKKAVVLCGTVTFISTVAAVMPLRLSTESNPWSNSFLALQLLMFLGFALTITLPNHSSTGFLWNQRRIGPINLSSERLLLSQLTGEIIGAALIWAIVVVLQSYFMTTLTETNAFRDFLFHSAIMLVAGITLLAWAQAIGSLLPIPAAMLVVICIVVLNHFLLDIQANPGNIYLTSLSLGIELIANQDNHQVDWPYVAMILVLMGSSIGIANLLSAWILEGYRGSLCFLDQGKRRS